MRRIQLDEDIDAKHLVKACRAEGKVEAKRFPSKMRNKGIADPVVLGVLIPMGNPILSIDLGLVHEHRRHVPDVHPGILLVGLDEDSVRTITTHLTQSMLSRFKRQIPQWETLQLRNSIIVVRESHVEVYHIENGDLERDDFLSREKTSFAEELTALLRRNAERWDLPEELP